MGEMNLVRSLGLAGIACALIAPAGSPARYSRFTANALSWEEFTKDLDKLAEMLVRFGETQPAPPVLYYEDDRDLLFVSRHRQRLEQAFRFVIPDAALVEDLVDKARFQRLAERLRLPVPASRCLRPGSSSMPEDVNLRFPIIVKPLTRRSPWDLIADGRKALEVPTSTALRHLWPHLASGGMDLLAQEMIPGPETCIESYHCYVDGEGEIIGEFTGRKVRTYPIRYGHSSALQTTDNPDVTALGRTIVEKLSLRGVAKLDFKRGPDGLLHLLEINPRYNLWHILGAQAGVNIPALVYADLTGLPRLGQRKARAGVHWCSLPTDLFAARSSGLSMGTWLRWVLHCDVKSGMNWDDPIPLVHGIWKQLPSLYGHRLADLRRRFMKAGA